MEEHSSNEIKEYLTKNANITIINGAIYNYKNNFKKQIKENENKER